MAIRYRAIDGRPSEAVAFIGELSFAESVGLIIRQKSMIAEIAFAERIDATGHTRRGLALQAEAAVAKILDVPLPHTHQRFDANAETSVLHDPAERDIRVS